MRMLKNWCALSFTVIIFNGCGNPLNAGHSYELKTKDKIEYILTLIQINYDETGGIPSNQGDFDRFIQKHEMLIGATTDSLLKDGWGSKIIYTVVSNNNHHQITLRSIGKSPENKDDDIFITLALSTRSAHEY